MILISVNRSCVTTFMMMGLSEHPKLQIFLFILFLSIYIVALIGNAAIIAAIFSYPKLHTPMYFFLFHLAVVDIVCISTIIPKMLTNIATFSKRISYSGCIAQLYSFTWCLGAEMVLFTVMAYDRYVAICHPLRYSIMMNKTVCVALSTVVILIAITNSWVHTGLIMRLTFCGPNGINHFFCEIPPLLALSCSPVRINEVWVFTADIFLAMGDFLITCLSYCFIVKAILNIRTSEGKKKAFSTCSSHLIVVSLYYSTVIYTYIRPASSYSFERDKVVAALYTLVTPTLNPIVYTLRNKDVKAALRKVFLNS
ncbi:olfactory receptor 13G1-like isoform X1 [Podarcis raffonei]|uniref:olfactory receptor 13G1-like isoform X1 n=1 Tax=Podarcis raffonei TaxID=65483 RepID=UPI00232976BA|nr:olfactory receptor 13G1-like isoform X1 [Podarcis raffonei]